jgi:hypothetical protein
MIVERARAGLRGLAIAIALLAIWDPAITRTRSQRPPVDVTGSAERGDVETRLAREGFPINSGATPVAIVATADRPPVTLPGMPFWALDVSQTGRPNVRVRRAWAGGPRLPGQSARVVAELEAQGAAGRTTDLVLEHDGIAVAAVKHQWTKDGERWDAVLDYLPPDTSPVTLRLEARPIEGEPAADNHADVRVRGARAPIRVLAYDPSVSWPAAFVRRSLEGEPAFALSAEQRVSTGIATRAGQPPAGLTRSSLTPYEVAIVGSPEQLSRGDVDALRWFAEERGGIIAFIPDRRPGGAYRALLGVDDVEERTLAEPVALGVEGATPLRSSELLVARRISPGSAVLARIGQDAVVVSSPRGAGRVVFFGAVDAWRSRAIEQEAFARFWRRTLVGAVASVPPRLEVEVEPALAAAGERVRVRARLRATELASASDVMAIPPASVRVTGSAARIDVPVRLWPAAEPGAYEGEWTTAGTGDFDVMVAMGDATADATLTVASAVARATNDDPAGLALAARASGGEVRPVSEAGALVSAIAARFPARSVRVSTHPMRSPWWLLPFAGALCGEWAWRRKRGMK